jgi:alkanesulfonate monooxygenase SsuD/methylene tetrahydromethanopterin reductase-like flavin-dependent oxidoreductase (luciferase family)
MLATASSVGLGNAHAQSSGEAKPEAKTSAARSGGDLRKRTLGFMLAHEQFPVPQLVEIGAHASRSGFRLLATSDHFQPWQPNEGHAGEAWVTLGALGAQAPQGWMGTTRWERLVEAIGVIRQLWTGQPVSHKGKYYTVDAKLYDPPAKPIPLLAAANGKKSMRLAGQHGDGLITDPASWQQHKSEWQDGARTAGKNPSDMPVLVEHYVVVGDETEAKRAAELWRFGPKAFKSYYNIADPARIRQRAEAEIPLDQVIKSWAVGTDPQTHIAAIQKLFDSGVTIVNVHSGQPDQKKVIDFYASHVLPKIAMAD